MIPVQQVQMAPDAPPSRRDPAPLVGPVVLTRQPCPATPPDTDIVVCARRDSDQFRIGSAPPPPPADGLLSRPLRVQLAPGVSFGFQRGGGFGLRTEFEPGHKSGE